MLWPPLCGRCISNVLFSDEFEVKDSHDLVSAPCELGEFGIIGIIRRIDVVLFATIGWDNPIWGYYILTSRRLGKPIWEQQGVEPAQR